MPTLYHYTSPAGLMGILESKTLWTSDYRFLNDTSEFRHGWSLVWAALESYEDAISAKFTGAWLLLDSLRRGVDGSRFIGLVGSLSQRGDLLSQWRGYNGGKGYSVGINDEWLNRNAVDQGFSLFPVLYQQDDQCKAADGAVRLLLGMLDDTRGDPLLVSERIKQWWPHALKVALGIKNEHFSEEAEFRLAYISDSWPSAIKMRPTSSGLVPYLPCRFDHTILRGTPFHPNNLGIEEIIVGPALRDAQLHAVDALLASRHMRVPVRKSAIPYVAD